MNEGIIYLLAREANGQEHVCRYTAGEMGELFTGDEWLAFTKGEVVNRPGVRFVSMIAAARAALQ
jgi:hypothetical protein